MSLIPEEKWLLVSDVDDTLVGDDSWERFVTTVQNTPALYVCLNSSRPVESIEKTLAEVPGDYPPHAMIGAMGTEVYVGGQPEPTWFERFGDWDRSVIDKLMEELGYEQHIPEYQRKFKASFAVPAADVRKVTEEIGKTGLPAQIIASGESDFDVLPPNAGKGPAALHVAEVFGVPIERLIVSGDSANDLAMFAVAQNGIVVGNARAELRERVDKKVAYFAEKHRADGVLEGLAHYGVPLGQVVIPPRPTAR